jgi:2-polyprenyl-3-methyl-5-hydroxy-6-metoxy-1,4-benzoquinol methylase
METVEEKESLLRDQAERYLASCDEYTHPEERERLITNWKLQHERTEGILADFKKRAGDPAGKTLLDIGYGSGSQLIAFARAGARISGLEVNPVLFTIAKDQFKKHGVEGDLRVYDGGTMPFNDGQFDFIFSASVLEHVSNPGTLIKESARVLAPGGRFYLAFPNRYTPREHHTFILWIGYLPRSWASFIVRTFFKRNSVEEINLHFLSYFTLLRLLRPTNLRIRFEENAHARSKRVLKYILARLGIHHSALLRTVMVVLEKPAT